MATPLSELQTRSEHANPPRRSLAQIQSMPRERQFPAMLEAFKQQIAVALPAHMTPDRMARIALTAFHQNPKLAECDPLTVFSSVIVSSQLGLEINVDGQAYLVPYWNNKARRMECQLIPGWKGLVDLVNRAKQASVWTGAVFAGDDFEYELGDRPFVRHKPNGLSDENKANLTHVYAIGRVHDAPLPTIEVWPVAKITRHLNRYNKVGDSHYALANDNNFIQYGRKVALLQVLKYVPKSVQLRAAQAIEAHGTAAVDLRDVIDGSWENVTDAANQAAERDDSAPSESGANDATAQTSPPLEGAAAASPSAQAEGGVASGSVSSSTDKPAAKAGPRRRSID